MYNYVPKMYYESCEPNSQLYAILVCLDLKKLLYKVAFRPKTEVRHIN